MPDGLQGQGVPFYDADVFGSLDAQQMHKYADEVVERLRVQVDQEGGPDSCWTWTETVRAHGYGVFNLCRRLDVARRVELSGVEAPAGFVVMCMSATLSRMITCGPETKRGSEVRRGDGYTMCIQGGSVSVHTERGGFAALARERSRA